MKNRGFTLVELSIVLVIIGLLVTGILIGQTLISSARIQSSIRQIQQFDIAVSNFKTKLKCLPGDCNKVSPAGNGDGNINEFPGGQDDRFAYEISYFWNHLSQYGFLKSDTPYLTDASTGIRRGIHTPEISMGNNSTIVALTPYEYTGLGANDYPDIINKPIYQIYNTSKTTNNSISPSFADVVEDSLKVEEMVAVESKIDDGNAITGNIRATGSGEHTYNAINATAGTGCVTPADWSKYNMSSTGSYPCSMLVIMLSQVGQ